MSHIRILVCRVDDDTDHNRMSELATIDLPNPDGANRLTEAILDAVEATTLTLGHAALRAALRAQWEILDARLVDAYLRDAPAAKVWPKSRQV